MRGRAFGCVAILIVTWCAARIGFDLLSDEAAPNGEGNMVAANTRAVHIPKSIFATQAGGKEDPLPYSSSRKVRWLPPRLGVLRRTASYQGESDKKYIEVEIARDSMDFVPSDAVTRFQTGPRKDFQSLRPITIFAYSFWRRGDASQGILSNGQYGGSQSAISMAISLQRFRKENSVSRLAFIGRASVSHDPPRERELALGLQWRPSASAPAQLTLERRVRSQRADAFAAFVSGGHDGTALPLGFILDGYGQAGLVTGKAGGAFADVQLHTLKPVVAQGRTTLAAGAGVWGGGQRDIMRLDIGPSVRANLVAGPSQLRLDASWRFRIAGDARPGNGPAITLSTSF